MPRGSSLALVLALNLIGCAAPYSPGALLRGDAAPFAAAFGCLELQAVPERVCPAPNVVIAYTMGNRCEHPTCFDISEMRAVAYQPEGERVELTAYDPRQELRRACLDGRAQVTERIVYVSEPLVTWPVATVCLNFSRLEQSGSRTVRCFHVSDAGAIPAGEP